MQEIIAPYVASLLESIKTGANFLIGEIPEVAKEIIKFSIIENIVQTVALFVITLLLITFALNIKRSKKKSGDGCQLENDNYPPYWLYRIFLIFGYCMLLISIIFFCVNLNDVLKAIFAPRLFLIEYLSNLLKAGV